MTPSISHVWLTDKAIWIRTEDGREAFELFDDYPRLRSASPAERRAYELTPWGIRWEALDEDLAFEGFLDKPPRPRLYQLFMRHPELNASAVARSLGISQSLFAQYLGGQKKPSPEREEAILDYLRELGRALGAV